MSPTLGEKLKQARESRGMTIGNVAEQTRITPHHLVAIEEDNYGGLPGGIFNKGFIRSFAKCVGINEDEALSDYVALTGVSAVTEKPAEELYSPAVYSETTGINSKISTIALVAVVALIVAVGLGAFVYYLFEEDGTPAVAETARVEEQAPASQVPLETPSPTPAATGISLEIAAADEFVQIPVEVDGTKRQLSLQPSASETINAESEVKLSIYRTLVPYVTLKLNGKAISLQKPRVKSLTVLIDKDNVGRIFEAGEYRAASGDPDSSATSETQAAASSTSDTGTAAAPSPTARPAANRATGNFNRPAGARPSANTSRPAGTRPRTAANTRPGSN